MAGCVNECDERSDSVVIGTDIDIRTAGGMLSDNSVTINIHAEGANSLCDATSLSASDRLERPAQLVEKCGHVEKLKEILSDTRGAAFSSLLAVHAEQDAFETANEEMSKTMTTGLDTTQMDGVVVPVVPEFVAPRKAEWNPKGLDVSMLPEPLKARGRDWRRSAGDLVYVSPRLSHVGKKEALEKERESLEDELLSVPFEEKETRKEEEGERGVERIASIQRKAVRNLEDWYSSGSG